MRLLDAILIFAAAIALAWSHVAPLTTVPLR